MKSILVFYFILFHFVFAEYSINDFEKVARKRFSSFHTKVDLLFNAYDEENESSDNRITLRVGLYDSDKRDRREEYISLFIEECIRLQEEIRLSKANLSFLREQEEYYIAASEEDKKEALVFERSINSSYIEKLFSIRERIFKENYTFNIAKKKLASKMLN